MFTMMRWGNAKILIVRVFGMSHTFVNKAAKRMFA